MMTTYSGIGVMTGTSLDGVDIAFCEFTEDKPHWKWKIIFAETKKFPEELKAKLIQAPQMSGMDLISTDRAFAHFIGKTIRQFCEGNKIKPSFAASHGQTIFHQPAKGITYQLGDGETIASHLDFPLVSNFRCQDVALGGQGAPLVPFGEINLFPESSLFLNLGGIANLGFGNSGFDVCACNLALNSLALQNHPSMEFDYDGKIAASGTVLEPLLDELNSDAYFRLAAPKSLGKEWFDSTHQPILQNWKNQPDGTLPNLMNTYCEHIAVQLKFSLLKLHTANEQILITGGGARNKYLMERIALRLKEIAVTLLPPKEELIDYKEALVFAFLGLMRLLGRENTLSTVTGARRNVIAGSISGRGKLF